MNKQELIAVLKDVDPWSKFDAAFPANPEPKEPGWFTSAELAARYGCSENTIRSRMSKAISAGQAETWMGLVKGKQVRKYRAL